MTASYAQAVAEGQRDERERIRTGVTGLNWAMLSHDAVLAVIDPA